MNPEKKWMSPALAVALAALLTCMATSPAFAQAQVGPPGEILIPGDRALPAAGEEVAIAVEAGMIIRLDLGNDELSDFTSDGSDLRIELQVGGVLVLQDLFASLEPRPRLFVNGMELPAATLLALTLSAEPEPAAGAPSGGGGEVFSLVQVISWFIDRIDFAAEVQAQEPAGAGAPPDQDMDLALLDRVDLQLRIARDEMLLAAAQDAMALLENLHADITRGIEANTVSVADGQQTEAALLRTQLDRDEAIYNLVLSVDRHQDRYGERLENSRGARWDFTLADDLAEATKQAHLGSPDRVRQYWRQARHAAGTRMLLDRLRRIAEDLCLSTRSQYNIGRRSLSEVITTCSLIYEVNVREVRSLYELAQAEAWLLAAEGALGEDAVLHPGWQ